MPQESAERPTRTNPIRRRCKNCGKIFMAKRFDHVFCHRDCRFQFHQFDNTAFGHVKHLMERHMKAHLKEFEKLKREVYELREKLNRVANYASRGEEADPFS